MTTDFRICLAVSLLAAFTDMKSRKVRNILVLPALLTGLLWNTTHGGFSGMQDAFLGAVLPLILFPFYIIRMLGAGDIKLLMALGAWLGLNNSLSLTAFSIICGGVMALGIIMIQQNGWRRLKRLHNYLQVCFLSGKLLPYQDSEQMLTDDALPFALAVVGGLICLLGQRVGLIPVLI